MENLIECIPVIGLTLWNVPLGFVTECVVVSYARNRYVSWLSFLVIPNLAITVASAFDSLPALPQSPIPAISLLVAATATKRWFIPEEETYTENTANNSSPEEN